ncbi:MAG: STAS domain-containing protein [Gammaproteobacteria bacterium]
MALYDDTPAVAMQVSRDVVVASIQIELNEDVLARFREDLLNRVHTSGSRGVILDVSGLETLDSDEFAALRQVITMCTILGAESILVGLQPGVVSSLIEAGAEVEGVRAAVNLDAAFNLLNPPELAEEEEGEADQEGEEAQESEPQAGEPS